LKDRAPKKFTQDDVDALRPDGTDRIVFDPTLPGFGVRLTAAGKKLFIARARAGGKRHYFNVGDADEVKLSQARRDADQMLRDLRDGRDPMLERAARRKAMEAGDTTIKHLAERWMAEVVKPKRKPRTVEDYQPLVDQKIGPKLGHLLVSRIEWDDVNKWHKDMAKTPRRANYAVAALKTLLHFAERVKLRPPNSNPCKGIEFYRERARERYLSEAEIAKAAGAIAKAEKQGKIGPHAAAGLRLALFTGARSGEITAAKWAHFNRAQKIIRLPDSKSNEPRTIHLSDAAMDVLAGVPRVEPFIIAGAKKDEPFKNLGRSWIVARAYADLGDVRLHDLRHSYASLAARKGVSLLMIGKLLGHKVAATTKRYAHIDRDAAADINEQLGAAMTAAIEKPGPGGKVVKMPKRRRARG
jgi:integrase